MRSSISRSAKTPIWRGARSITARFRLAATSVCITRRSRARSRAKRSRRACASSRRTRLLLKKHPERYRTLFLREQHYANTPGFAEHFLRGAAEVSGAIDEFYLLALRRPFGASGFSRNRGMYG